MRSSFVPALTAVLALACGDTAPAAFRGSTGPSAAGGSGGASSAMSNAPGVTAGGTGGMPSAASGGTSTSISGGAPSAGGTVQGAGGAVQPIMTSGAAGYPYDPGVTFDWPSTTPMAGKCQPGTYSGMFSCDVDIGIFGKATFAGPVSFTLTASPTGEFLEITNGMLQGTANGSIPFSSDLTGKLDCTTNLLTATTSNGMATIALIFATPIAGSLEGRLDRLSQTLAGTWTLGPDTGMTGSGGAAGTGGAAGAGGAAAPNFACTGTWSVVRQ